MTDRQWMPFLTERDREQGAQLKGLPEGIFVPDPPGASAPYLASLLPGLLGGPVVVVVDGPHALDAFARDLTSLQDGVEPALYPPWESLPGRGADSPADLTGDRLEILRRLLESEPPALLVTCIHALMQRTMAPQQFARRHTRLDRGRDFDFSSVLKTIVSLGYDFEVDVTAKGQAAHRGGIIDVWPPTATWPYRLEFFGPTLDSVRSFDPANQRSIESADNVTVVPAREVDLREGGEALAAIFPEYLPPATRWVWCDADRIRAHAVQYEKVIEEAEASAHTLTYRSLRAAINRRFKSAPVYLGGTRPRNTTAWPIAWRPVASLPALSQAGLDQGALEEVRHEYVDELAQRVNEGETVRLYFGTSGTMERFVEWRQSRADPRRSFHLCVGPLSEGFHYTDGRLIIVCEQDLYGKRREWRGRYDPHARRRGPSALPGPRLAEWRDIQPGELVVHVAHGIGRYLGLYEIETDGRRQEVLSVEYADNAKLFLPVSQAHLLSRYIGFGKQRPDLHALGGKRWMREKIAAERAVRDLAALLLETQAARQTEAGHAFAVDAPWQHEFENAFPFEETADQLRAIREVKADMESARPMDRLICGDVGYGKTEVAMRAAFKAVMDGRQVALLVPTTILAQQHFETFRERMAAFPVRIEMLSRFRTRGAQRRIVEDLNAGRVDIVIGTHRLVQPDVQFKRLGLVVIDEEQRFGVEHKEHLKALRRLVDVLTMTATPIPRTLYMSLAGARDISTIQTPPQERLPVETVVTEYNEELIRDAIHRELSREGQIFYLHNRVHSIERTRKKLETLVPAARIAVGHGQMNERELESVMTAFVRGEYDILLCTTIIESGVDIPNVNTIFIERADRFGLSDLYQLRGRVGRYKHKAYAYLLLPRHGQLFSAARERVRAIRKYTGLGSGFKLAMRDLEIRGAGNILGAEQSGHIAAVGFDLYCQFLRRTVARMKGETPPPVIDVEARLDFIDAAPAHGADPDAAVIPLTYVEDEHARVDLYRRIAGLAMEEEVETLRAELKDRFGPVPDALDRLLAVSRIRIVAQAKNVREIEVRGRKVMMKRRGDWLQQQGRFPRLTGETASDRLQEIEKLIRHWPD